MNMDKTVGSIYETRNYEKFKKLPANRDARTEKRIVESIKKVGYVLSPILVNEKFEVIDGQNRLEALKTLGLPVLYMVQDGIGIEECRNLNIGQANWATKQFIKSYAESGNASYQRLYDLVVEYGGLLSIEGVLSFAVPGLITATGGGRYAGLRDGNIELSEKDYKDAEKAIETVIKLGYYDYKKRNDMTGRTYWSAVAYAYRHPGVSMDRLIRKMNEDPKAIVACAKLSDQLAYFDDAYNRGLHTGNKVFMAADIQNGLYLRRGGAHAD